MRYTPSKTLLVSGELRERLKRPMGELIRGKPGETRGRVLERVRGASGRIIAVGDVVSRELMALGVEADAYVVDGRVERRAAEEFTADKLGEMRCRNEPGTISPEAYRAMAEAIERGGGVILRVDGEEDLLGLVAVAEAPVGSVVLYGQPGIGVVIVRVDEEKIREAIDLMKSAES